MSLAVVVAMWLAVVAMHISNRHHLRSIQRSREAWVASNRELISKLESAESSYGQIRNIALTLKERV